MKESTPAAPTSAPASAAAATTASTTSQTSLSSEREALRSALDESVRQSESLRNQLSVVDDKYAELAVERAKADEMKRYGFLLSELPLQPDSEPYPVCVPDWAFDIDSYDPLEFKRIEDMNRISLMSQFYQNHVTSLPARITARRAELAKEEAALAKWQIVADKW